jgi:hypothetical protein
MNRETERIVDFPMENAARQFEIMMNRPHVQWHLAMRKQEGRKIDPRTAEVTVRYAQFFDPYGLCSDLPDELWYVGRMEFARAPGSETWVVYRDLPEATRNALWPPGPQPKTDDVQF